MKLYSQVMHVNVVNRPMRSINMRNKADFLLFVSVRSAGHVNTRADLLGCFFHRLGFMSAEIISAVQVIFPSGEAVE